jgi:secreted PhoX family phosphatase
MKKITLSLIVLATATFAQAQNVFPTLDVNIYDQSKFPTDPNTVVIPASPLKYDVLFIGGTDTVTNHNGDKALAKEWQDFTGYVPINGRSDSGYVIVNHEMVTADPVNGDGGGMTVFTAYYNQKTKSWEVKNDAQGKFRNVDFSNVGGTGANCGGIQTNWGKVFTAEEWGDAFTSNKILAAQGMTDTSNYTIKSFNGQTVNQSVERYKNFQYMVEVDVKSAKAIRKNYNMGRYDHEGGWIASDRKTVYLTDDYSSGAIFFKFVADAPEDFSKGQLYAYKQSNDAQTGTWLPLSMDLNTMISARDAAFKLGATIFMRLEWVEGINDEIIFIAETGRGKAQSVKSALLKGANLASHLVQLDANDGKLDSSFNDMWGRVLRFNVSSGKMETALDGGGLLGKDYKPTNNHLSSPDGLTHTVINGRVYLSIQEDMNPSGMPANPAQFANVACENYMLDVTGDHDGVIYNITDLKRFMVGPKGCEITGGRFSPDGSTYFVNIQHPSTSNTFPFNHSVTLAITGYKTIFNESFKTQQALKNSDFEKDGFQMFPNPASREVYFNTVTDAALYSIDGKRIKVVRETNVIDVADLSAGTYVLKTAKGDTHKLIVQ